MIEDGVDKQSYREFRINLGTDFERANPVTKKQSLESLEVDKNRLDSKESIQEGGDYIKLDQQTLLDNINHFYGPPMRPEMLNSIIVNPPDDFYLDRTNNQ